MREARSRRSEFRVAIGGDDVEHGHVGGGDGAVRLHDDATAVVLQQNEDDDTIIHHMDVKIVFLISELNIYRATRGLCCPWTIT